MSTITSEHDVNRSNHEITNLWSRNWQAPTPKAVSSAYERGETDAGWQQWTKYLARRTSLHSLLENKTSPILWAVPTGMAGGDSERLIRALHKAARGKKVDDVVEQIAPWLTESSGRSLDVAYGLECLAWSYAIISLAKDSAASLWWWELLCHLLTTVEDATALDASENPVEHCLFACELPLVLAQQLPELKGCAALAKPARRALNQAIDELLDGEGLPHARWLPIFPGLVAGWTRCRAFGADMPKGCWNKKTERQYQWIVTQCLRLVDDDGSHPTFGKPLMNTNWPPLLQLAIELGGDDADAELADHLLPGRLTSSRPRYEWPDVSYSSEWAELAVLQNRWSRKNKKLIVAYDQPQTRIELSAAGEPVFAGSWTFDIQVDGQRLLPAEDAEWEQVAWESDQDVDYMELEIDLSHGWRLQRSVLLARDDDFLLMADAVLGDQPAKLAYNARLSLATEVEAIIDDQHSEISLCTPKSVTRVLPLALSEWKVDRRNGELREDDGVIELQQQGNRSLFAPLFVDLSRSRHKKQLTWRQLSIGQMRKNEPPEAAVGYRVQIGDEQWLIFRSLTPPENRTVLGQNLMCEMHVSRFLDTGEVEELLELE